MAARQSAAADRGRTIRPRDAATLLIVRKSRRGAEILLGERSAKHAFFANHYVFPGGKVDRSDGYAPAATPLRGHVADCLERAATPHRARAIAMAAIRETFEETGLIVGEAAAASGRPRAARLGRVLRHRPGAGAGRFDLCAARHHPAGAAAPFQRAVFRHRRGPGSRRNDRWHRRTSENSLVHH